MDVLRARAYLDLLLGKDSRPRPDAAGQDGTARETGGTPGAGPAGPGQPSAPPRPAGFAGRVNLTVPLTTATGLAGPPGEIPGSGRPTRGWPATLPPPPPGNGGPKSRHDHRLKQHPPADR